MKTTTVGDVIKALQKYPMDTPVFGYNSYEEADSPIEVIELCGGPCPKPEFINDEHREWYERWFPVGQVPLATKGDSCIQMYWEEHGVQPVLVLRDAYFSEGEE